MPGILLILAFLTWVARAQTVPSVTLTWDSQTNVAGYFLHYGTASGMYSYRIDAGSSNTCTVPGISPAITYFFEVAAYDQLRVEGDYSDEVNYNVPNHPPMISKIPDQILQMNVSTAPIPFSVGDMETPAANLQLAADSSNPWLIPISNIQFSGQGSNRTATITPMADRIGRATITVFVSDGNGATITNSFVLVVNPIGTGPTLDEIADLTIQTDAGSQTVALAGISSGTTNALGILPVAITVFSSNAGLIPSPVIEYTNPQKTGGLTFTNVAGESGTARISVIVSALPNALPGLIIVPSLVRSFTVTVTPPDTAPTLDPINDMTMLQDAGPQVIDLTGISAGSTNGFPSLVLAANSSNPALLPSPNIRYLNPNPIAKLYLTPALHATGTTLINILLQDNGATAQAGLGQANQSFMVTILPLPQLQMEPLGNGVRLSWPPSISGFVLESSKSFFPADWNPVLDPFPILNKIVLPTTDSSRFFRLRKL